MLHLNCIILMTFGEKGVSMWILRGLKRLRRVVFGPDIQEVQEDLEGIEGLTARIDEFTRDLASVHTSIQRIERKQLRWIEMLNLKDAIKAQPDNGSDDIVAAEALTNLKSSPVGQPAPGDIVE